MDNVIYLTAEGIEKIRVELEMLTSTKRLEIAQRLRAAIEMGDLSENADYTSAKEDQAFLEGRILELAHILKNVVVIEEKGSGESVEIGSEVVVREEGYDDEETLFIVGSKEANPEKGKISYESPIGKALLKHRVGEIVRVATPSGYTNFKILKIK